MLGECFNRNRSSIAVKKLCSSVLLVFAYSAEYPYIFPRASTHLDQLRLLLDGQDLFPPSQSAKTEHLIIPKRILMSPKRPTNQATSHPVHKAARTVLHKHQWLARRLLWLLRVPKLRRPRKRAAVLSVHRLAALCASTMTRRLPINPRLQRRSALDW